MPLEHHDVEASFALTVTINVLMYTWQANVLHQSIKDLAGAETPAAVDVAIDEAEVSAGPCH
jgi:hypothetical protein